MVATKYSTLSPPFTIRFAPPDLAMAQVSTARQAHKHRVTIADHV